jgi:hypothetical protein
MISFGLDAWTWAIHKRQRERDRSRGLIRTSGLPLGALQRRIHAFADPGKISSASGGVRVRARPSSQGKGKRIVHLRGAGKGPTIFATNHQARHDAFPSVTKDGS